MTVEFKLSDYSVLDIINIISDVFGTVNYDVDDTGSIKKFDDVYNYYYVNLHKYITTYVCDISEFKLKVTNKKVKIKFK